MKKKGATLEQIIGKLRETEVPLNQRNVVGEVTLKFGISSMRKLNIAYEYLPDLESGR